eukprot:TRINITY_DN31896_c0_g1_i1.p1 TRINITY_DN31896_c0_g1~~TRINITY_DN31896_c0_g1_i1.p1  ORF type:complete len:577 (+),score=98.47 TRINITY_DN31896_c0_g1_i1:43-1773(+)
MIRQSQSSMKRHMKTIICGGMMLMRCSCRYATCFSHSQTFVPSRLAWGLARSRALQGTRTLSARAGHARIVVSTENDPGDDASLRELLAVDHGFPSRVVTAPSKQHERLILSPTGTLLSDTDDVRKVGAAAAAGALAAFAMGASKLAMKIDKTISQTQHPVDGAAYAHAELVAELAVHQAAYKPLQAREADNAASVLESVRVEGKDCTSAVVSAIEDGRILARDVGSGDPERMAPPALAELVKQRCEAAGIEVDILQDQEHLGAQYPLLMAVARAAKNVERHHARVVRLAWSGDGPVERTICIAGKGVTFDTGGADIKIGGGMAGMRNDKCGAAAAAGFILACAKAPKEMTRNLRVLVELGCVRNSVGSEAFVADEIVTGHAGKRVLIGNTDAEGRLVLADCLSHLRQAVLADPQAHPKPVFLSLGTLTGHAVRSFGPYAVATDNGAARAAGGLAPKLAAAGSLLGQPLEVSSLRREDYEFIAPGCSGTPISKCGASYDVLQSNNAATVNTIRGHQFPMAFLTVASGLQEHSAASTSPLPYCHMDLAASVIDFRGVETGSPIVPLFGHFVLKIGSP